MTGASIEVIVAGNKSAHPLPLHLPLFEMLQKTRNNSAKHAHGTTVCITLALEPQSVCLTLQDDDVGMTTQQAHNPETRGLL